MARLSWFIIPLTLASWFYARNIYWESVKDFYHRNESSFDLNSKPEPHAIPQQGQGPQLGENPENLFYFIQISDLHISKYRKKYLGHLRMFLNGTLKMVNPKFVLVTGDLTDAKDERKITSMQIRDEWV